MTQTFKDIQERTDILNKDADKRSVLDSIDRPIRPLVVELNRIGLATTFSCCGYTYDGQEEPKCHDKNPYVLFETPVEFPAIKSFFRMSAILGKVEWGLNACSNGREWCIYCNPRAIWDNHDNLSEPLHDYELKLIAIVKLTQIIKDFPSASDKITIRDGNAQRRSLYGEEWVVAPKKEVVIESDKIQDRVDAPFIK